MGPGFFLYPKRIFFVPKKMEDSFCTQDNLRMKMRKRMKEEEDEEDEDEDEGGGR
jgi:hypothetical protein